MKVQKGLSKPKKKKVMSEKNKNNGSAEFSKLGVIKKRLPVIAATIVAINKGLKETIESARKGAKVEVDKLNKERAQIQAEARAVIKEMSAFVGGVSGNTGNRGRGNPNWGKTTERIEALLLKEAMPASRIAKELGISQPAVHGALTKGTRFAKTGKVWGMVAQVPVVETPVEIPIETPAEPV